MRIKTFETWEGFEKEERTIVEFLHEKKTNVADNIETLFKTIYGNRYGKKCQCWKEDNYWNTELNFYLLPQPISNIGKPAKSILTFHIRHSSDNNSTVYIYMDNIEFSGFLDQILDQTVSNTSSIWNYYWLMWNKGNDDDAKVSKINYEEYKKYSSNKIGQRFDL